MTGVQTAPGCGWVGPQRLSDRARRRSDYDLCEMGGDKEPDDEVEEAPGDIDSAGVYFISVEDFESRESRDSRDSPSEKPPDRPSGE